MSLFSITLVLFLIMDPIGNVSSFLKMINDTPPGRQKLIILREMGFALIAMLFFNYLGEYIFQMLDISEITVRLTSGLILFLFALKILFPAIDSPRLNLPKEEPFITPLAIPLIAGPSLLATVMLYAHMESSQPLMLAAILISWLAASAVLLCSSFLKRTIGTNGLMAAERLMAMVLILIAIQRFFEGIQQFIVNK